MKFHAEIGDDKHEVEIKHGEGKIFADVDGRTYELDASEPEPGVFLFKHDNRVYEAVVTDPVVSGDPLNVRIGEREYEIRLTDPKRLRSTGGDTDSADGPAQIKTAMPGKVVRILVAPGAVLEKGDGVLIVEAMKMQNELKAPKAGTVKEIRVQEGATVAAGDILATIE